MSFLALPSPLDAAANAARDVVCRLAQDDSGQDIVEYVLLTALISVGSIAVWQQLAVAVGNAYTATDAGVQGQWQPPDPQIP